MKQRPRRQCEKCPWKVSTNPRDIPNGYDAEKHRALERTIAPDTINAITSGTVLSDLRLMACHESPLGREVVCVGWLHNQLGPGNNIGLRFAVHLGRIDAHCVTVGPQHENFNDTLPD